ncbi:MAG: PH domain-containing protein [Luteimonas sp.]
MTMTSTDPQLDLQPPSNSVRIWLFLLVVALPVGVALAATWQGMASDGPKRLIADSETMTWLAVMGGTSGLMLAIGWFIDRMLRRHRIALGPQGIEITTTFYRQSLALAELQLAQARVVDLDEHTELKPSWKTNGTALPGFKSGWFRMRNRHKAFVAMTTGPRVLWLPTSKGHDLLLQPRQPQALLDRLREMAATARHD